MRNILICLSIFLLAHTVHAAGNGESTIEQQVMSQFDTANAYTSTNGQVLYESHCQSCHMPQGKGVNTGVGMYPALADNDDVISPEYTALIIINGLRGMPSFGTMFSNEQISAISNYVATNFGNKGTSAVTSEEVQAIRPETPVVYED